MGLLTTKALNFGFYRIISSRHRQPRQRRRIGAENTISPAAAPQTQNKKEKLTMR
jgi:hypothetical protein